MVGGELRFAVLGPLAVSRGDVPIPIDSPKQRLLLLRLLVQPGIVSTDELVDALWGEAPPPSAHSTLKTHAANLRRRLGGNDVLVGHRGGYELCVEPDQVDAQRFERLIHDAERSPARRGAILREALGLWRGAAYADARYERFAMAEATRLEELRVVAVERRIDAELDDGHHTRLVAELESLVADHPLREGFRARLMTALYRSGRQADALRVAHDLRQALRDELGLEPGPEVAELEVRILRQDPALRAPSPAVQTPHQGQAALGALVTASRFRFVGRVSEMKFLRSHWASAATGERRVVTIAGEPGVGKTRLAAELCDVVRTDGALILSGRCDEDLSVPYQPFVDALVQYVERHDPDEVGESLGRDPASLVALCPRLAPYVPASGAMSSSDAPMERYRLFDAVASWLAALTSQRPTLLVLDDLQWATEPTLLLLRHVVRSLSPARLMVLGTYRPTDIDARHPLAGFLADLHRLTPVRHLDLAGLTENEVLELVTSATGHDLHDAGRGIARVIHRETEGNAFFVEEFAQHLLDTGSIAFQGDGWRLAEQPDTSVPRAVRNAVSRRLARLPEPDADVLVPAAVIGAEFDLAVLAAVAQKPADAVLAALEGAGAAGLVREVSGATYVFAHAMVRQAVYDSISVTRRQRLHLAIAEVLERVAGADRAAAIAGHLLHGGDAVDRDRLVDACIDAGEAARRVLAWEDAIRHWTVAATLLEGVDADRLRLASLLERVGDALLTTQVSTPGVSQLERARHLYDQLGDRRAAARVRIRIARNVSFGSERLDLPRAFDNLDRAIEVLTAEGDSPELAFALTVRASACWYAMRVSEGIESAEQAVAIADRLGDEAAATNAASVLGTNLFNAGRIREGVHLMLAGVEGARGARHSWASVKQTAEHCNLLLDPGAGRRVVEQEISSGRYHSAPALLRSLQEVRAEFLLAEGRVADAIAVAQEAGAGPESRFAGELALVEGRWDEAGGVIDAAVDFASSRGDLSTLISLAVARATLALLQQDIEAADAALTRARARSPRQLATWASLRLDALGAIVSARRGMVADANEKLGRCRAILASGEDYRGLAGLVEVAEAATSGDPDEAERRYTAAAAAFRRYDVPWYQLFALSSWAAAGGDRARQLGAALAERLEAAPAWRQLFTELVGQPLRDELAGESRP